MRRTSTTILWVQCGAPDLNLDPVSSVWCTGPQAQSCEDFYMTISEQAGLRESARCTCDLDSAYTNNSKIIIMGQVDLTMMRRMLYQIVLMWHIGVLFSVWLKKYLAKFKFVLVRL